MAAFIVSFVLVFLQKLFREHYLTYIFLLIFSLIWLGKRYLNLGGSLERHQDTSREKKHRIPKHSEFHHSYEMRRHFCETVSDSDSTLDSKVRPGYYKEHFCRYRRDPFGHRIGKRPSDSSVRGPLVQRNKPKEPLMGYKRNGPSRYIELRKGNAKSQGFSGFHSTTPLCEMGFSSGLRTEKYSSYRKSPNCVVVPKEINTDSCWSTPCPVEPSRSSTYKLPLMDSTCILLESAYRKQKKGCIVIWSPSENLWETETDNGVPHESTKRYVDATITGPLGCRRFVEKTELVSKVLVGKRSTVRYRRDPYKDSGRGLYCSSVRRRYPKHLPKKRYYFAQE